jgi:hypothetical protein
MRVLKDSEGLNYKLKFLHNGIWAHECIVPPHNVEKMITTVWRQFNDKEIMWEEVPLARLKAIRFPGRPY